MEEKFGLEMTNGAVIQKSWNERAMWRSQWLAAIMLLLTAGLLMGLLGRVAWIQRHVNGEDLTRLDRQHDAVQPVMANRGAIRMSDGTVVAASVRMYNLYADPAFIMDPGGKLAALQAQLEQLRETAASANAKDQAKLETQIAQMEQQADDNTSQTEEAKNTLAEALAPLLERPAEEVRGLIQANVSYPTGKPRRFLWLAREVDDDFRNRFLEQRQKLRIQAADLSRSAKDVRIKEQREKEKARATVLAHALDGVGFSESVQRQHPLGALAGSVIGFANAYKGVDGLEAQLDPLLTGRWGQVTLLKDAQRHTVMMQDKQYVPPEHGCNAWLTIDTMMQSIAEEELAGACVEFKSEGGCAIVLDPSNGRIMAMANYPTFDPSHFQTAVPETRKNKSVVDPYEPGSMFKSFVAAWGIEKGIIQQSDVFDCHNGHWTDPTGRAITDDGAYGEMTVEDILVKSSNIGMTQVGWKMGKANVWEAATRFGFGARTGVELPGDGKGLVKPLAKWNYGTLTSVSFGYEVEATPLQLIRGFSTFANGGYLVTPQIMYAVEDEPGHIVSWQEVAGPPEQRQIISAKTAETMRDMLEGVLIRGTGKTAKSKVYRFFGKSGTAHLALPGGHYAQDQYNASFLAGGPMSGPKLVALVTLHKPDKSLGHFGGPVAGPAASRILERCLMYLQVPGDQVAEKKAVRTVAAQ